jgi:hypothetical protein
MGISPLFRCQFETGVRLNSTALSLLVFIKAFNFSKISDTKDQCCYQCNIYITSNSSARCDYFFETRNPNGAYLCQMYYFKNRNQTFIYNIKQGFYYTPISYSITSGMLGYSKKFV